MVVNTLAKYSPTVYFWYQKNPEWFLENRDSFSGGIYDTQGYDKYGYSWRDKTDRAGFTESDYISDYCNEDDLYYTYDSVLNKWHDKPIMSRS